MKVNTVFPEKKPSWRKFTLVTFLAILSFMLLWPAGAARGSQILPPPVGALSPPLIFEAIADSYIADSYKDYNLANENFGADGVLVVGKQTDPYPASQTIYLKFFIDLSKLPPNAVITSAWLQLYLVKATIDGVVNLGYGWVMEDWDEYKITGNQHPPCEIAFGQTTEFGAYPVNRWINTADFFGTFSTLPRDFSFEFGACVTPQTENYDVYFSSREGFDGKFTPHIIIAYYVPTTITPTITPWPTPTDTLEPSVTPSPSPSPPSRIRTTPPQPPDRNTNNLWWIIGGIALGAGFLGYLLFRPHKPPSGSQGQPPEEPPKKPIIPPALPPLRLLRFWLTKGGPGGEQPVADNAPLAAGEVYNLNVQLQVRTPEQAGTVGPDARSIPVDLVLYSPESDFWVEQRRAVLEIPASGSSARVILPIRAQAEGVRRLRLCVYYQNTLLQSGVLEAAVTAGAASGRGGGAQITRQLDYVASPFLTQLGQSTRPALNIFTNDTSEGTHWVGVYSSEPDAGEKLRQGQLFVFEAAHLAHLAQVERQKLSEVQEGRGHQMDSPLPLDERSLAKLEQSLVSLAVEGFRLYNDLFLNDPSGLGMDTLRKFDAILRTPGIISIARCRGTSTSLPWAGLYTFPLKVDRPQELRVCPLFKQELQANQWTGRTAMNPIQDHLDAPGECLSQPGCPVRAAGDRGTVCPFGFWGWMHQIEQPLQQIKPTSVDTVPESLQKRDFAQNGVLLWKAQQKLRCAVAVNKQFVMEDEVYARVQSTIPTQALDIERSTDANRILELIKDGGRHFYYFICHGVIRDENFQLEFSPGAISSAGLYPFDMDWPEQPKPLFILNACESSATRPDLIHGFLEKLRLLGVSGVVGTEVPVAVSLAIPFGSLLMYFMLTGSSIGEAFLKLRSQLLRQGNPLGLLYAYYAPADLHLHQEENCAWCQAHGIRL